MYQYGMEMAMYSGNDVHMQLVAEYGISMDTYTEIYIYIYICI